MTGHKFTGKTDDQLHASITQVASDIEQVVKDNKQKTFAVQSLTGQRARLRALTSASARLLEADRIEGFRQLPALLANTHSQFLQEVFAYVFSGFRQGGYFVEFGACDGLHLSNTLKLERDLGWRGILSEPAQAWQDALKANRGVAIEPRCVWTSSNERLRFFQANEPGQSTASAGAAAARVHDREYEVETISLLDLLREHQAPSHIDYLSIDTEGTEPDILEAFDFDAYRFGFVSVEVHPTGPKKQSAKPSVPEIMQAAGYREVFARTGDRSLWSEVSGFDRWFVPEETYKRLQG